MGFGQATRRAAAIRLCCGALLAGSLASGTAHGDGALTVTVSPAVCGSPCSTTIRIRHRPAAGDRTLVVETDGPWFYRSSSIPLKGADEASTHRIGLKSVPSGEYIVRVSLERELETAAHAETVLVVIGQDQR